MNELTGMKSRTLNALKRGGISTMLDMIKPRDVTIGGLNSPPMVVPLMKCLRGIGQVAKDDISDWGLRNQIHVDESPMASSVAGAIWAAERAIMHRWPDAAERYQLALVVHRAAQVVESQHSDSWEMVQQAVAVTKLEPGVAEAVSESVGRRLVRGLPNELAGVFAAYLRGEC